MSINSSGVNNYQNKLLEKAHETILKNQEVIEKNDKTTEAALSSDPEASSEQLNGLLSTHGVIGNVSFDSEANSFSYDRPDGTVVKDLTLDELRQLVKEDISAQFNRALDKANSEYELSFDSKNGLFNFQNQDGSLKSFDTLEDAEKYLKLLLVTTEIDSEPGDIIDS